MCRVRKWLVLVRAATIFSFVAALVVWAAIPLACAAPSPAELAIKQSVVAFRCADLAVWSVREAVWSGSEAQQYIAFSVPSRKEDADRLFRYGVKRFRAGFPKDKAAEKVAIKKFLGDFSPWNAPYDMSPDFWLGGLWASTNADIDDLMGKKMRGKSMMLYKDNWSLRSSLIANNEFARSNCGLVGR